MGNPIDKLAEKMLSGGNTIISIKRGKPGQRKETLRVLKNKFKSEKYDAIGKEDKTKA